MTYEELVKPFILRSNTFLIEEQLSEPLYLDIQNYNYYLKLLSVQFSNVVPNVFENLYVKNGSSPQQLVVIPGIWTISQIIDFYNALSPGAGKLELLGNRLKLTNDTGSTMTLTGNLLTNPICGFSAAQLVNIANGAEVIANNVVVIQEYNFFILSSPNFEGNTLVKREGQSSLGNTSGLYAFTSAIPAYDTWEWTAMMPMLFQIKTDNIQNLTFELKDGLDRTITQILGQSDFSVQGQIVRQRKLERR